MRSDLICRLGSCAFLLAPAGAADLIVGPSGSGAPFTRIQAAIDAAQPGDRVIVRAGIYQEAVVLSKAIELIGAGPGASVISTYAFQFPGMVPPPLTVQGIAAGERALVRGFRCELRQSAQLVFPIGALASVSASPGRVELADLELLGTGLPQLPFSAGNFSGILLLLDAEQVVLDRVAALGSSAPSFSGYTNSEGHAGLYALRSNVWISSGDLLATSGGQRINGEGGAGGHGLLAIDSYVQLARSRLRGAGGGGFRLITAGEGGSGLFAIRSEILFHGGEGAASTGADAREQIVLGFASHSTAGPGLSCDAASRIAYAPDVAIAGGAPSANLPGAPAIVAALGAVIDVLAERAPSLAFSPGIVALGAATEIHYRGEPGALHLRCIAATTGPAIFLPGISGALLLDPLGLVLTPAVALDANGVANLVASVPLAPLLAGHTFAEQSVQLTPSALSFAPPALLAIAF